MLSVLVISPAPEVQGGVSVFIEMMKSRLARCNVTSVYVGSLPGKTESLIERIKRVAITPFKIAHLVLSQQMDAIHINPSLNAKSLVRDGLILLALQLIQFRRILVYFHGWEIACAERIQHNIIARIIFAWLLNGADKIIVLAPEFKESLIAMGIENKRIITSHTMFDGDAIHAAKNGASSSQARTILYMSRFIREKGVYELFTAFVGIASSFPDVNLIMAGNGEELESLQVLAASYGLEKRVSFPGYVEGTLKYTLLNNCTLFALPTYYPEGMPIALLEAMGAGKPILTGNAGGISHIISEPENGIVLETITATTVEAGLRHLLSDKNQCAEIGKRNELYAWEHFEASEVTAEIEALYQAIASAHA